MTSIIKADNISTVSGSGNINVNTNMTLPTGVKVVGADAGSFVAPGNIVQTVVMKSLVMAQHNSSSFVELSSNYRLSITPKYNTSKILLQASMCINPHCAVNTLFGWTLKRSTDSGSTFSFFSDESDGNTGSRWGINGGFTRRGNGHDTNDMNQITWQAWDSPATTSTVMYSPFLKQETSGTNTIYVNHSSGNTNNWGFHTAMLIIAQEIAQ